MLRIVLGGVVLIALLIFSLGTALVIGLQGRGLAALSSADWSAVKFTLWQASLSAILSIAMAIPVARALARQSFPGRQVLITLLGAPFILPVIVGVLGLLAVFGRAGWISSALDWAGFAKLSIYGAPGVVLAHVFFNLPLVTRLLLQAWTAIPAERFRVAESLGASPWAYFRLIEGPMLRATVPGAFLLVFLLCLTSFVVALAVGGGPRAQQSNWPSIMHFAWILIWEKRPVLLWSSLQFVVHCPFWRLLCRCPTPMALALTGFRSAWMGRGIDCGTGFGFSAPLPFWCCRLVPFYCGGCGICLRCRRKF